MVECYLPVTEVKLGDGKSYKFRGLPFNEQSAKIVEHFLRTGQDGEIPPEMFPELVEVIKKSLSWDQDDETIRLLLDSGLIPLPTTTTGGEIISRIMEALINQAGTGTSES